MKKGSALLVSLMIIASLLSLSTFLARMAVNDLRLANLNSNHSQAFYLAESGLELAKQKIAANSAWFTDLKHLPLDDCSWLLNLSQGEKINLAGGSIKVVRCQGQPQIYSIGNKMSSVVILKFNKGDNSWAIL